MRAWRPPGSVRACWVLNKLSAAHELMMYTSSETARYTSCWCMVGAVVSASGRDGLCNMSATLVCN